MIPTSKGQRIGYVRVSSVDQNEARQLEAIGACDRIYSDKASGKDTHRPALQDMLDFAREGDVIVVQSMDRLARNLADLQQLVDRLTARGVVVQFLKENLIFNGESSPISNLMLSMLGSIAQFERELIRERQKEGVAIAKRLGRYKGSQKKLSSLQRQELLTRIAAGERKAVLAKEYGIHRDTIYEYMKQQKQS